MDGEPRAGSRPGSPRVRIAVWGGGVAGLTHGYRGGRSELKPESRLWLFKAGGRWGQACTLAPGRGQARTAAIKAATSLAVLGTSVPSLTPQTEKASQVAQVTSLDLGISLANCCAGPRLLPSRYTCPVVLRDSSSSRGGTSCNKGLDTHVT